jgi:hypothetical protein
VSSTACYWGGNSLAATGTGLTQFGPTDWPSEDPSDVNNYHLQWGTGDGSEDGKYWKSLGGWDIGEGGTPVYPKLHWEKD